jgi:hypothetical protein
VKEKVPSVDGVITLGIELKSDRLRSHRGGYGDFTFKILTENESYLLFL